ncbi:MAG: restriction endonuclease subunit S [Balneolales bacterium]
MRDGWRTVSISEVCNVIAGQSPKGSAYNNSGNGLPFYQGKKKFGEVYIGAPTTWTTQVTKEAQSGDVLMSVRAPVGPINFSKEKICIGRGLAAIRALELIDRKYLYYSLLFKQKEIIGNEGAVFASINKKQIESIIISLPPLPEQKRIVALLDEAFAGIEKVVANTEKNLANARELFESYLNSVFSENDKVWEEKKLGDLTVVQSGGTPLKSKPKYWDGDIAWYSSGELNHLYTEEPKSKITATGLDNSNAKMFPAGSLLIGMYDTAALKMSILDRDAAFNQAISGAKPNEDINLLFVFLAINTRKSTLLNLRRGVRQKNLSLRKIKEIKIHFPELKKQDEIVNKVLLVKEETERLEKIYQQKLTALAELKQSLLQKAFSGELTAEDKKQAEKAA